MKPKAVFLALAVSLVLLIVLLPHVAKAGCCETPNFCFNTADKNSCFGGTFHANRVCCNNQCVRSCSTTSTTSSTTSTTTTTVNCNPPPTDYDTCVNDCHGSWGGCKGKKICCLPGDKKVAACYDPPGGGNTSVCRNMNDGTTTILEHCYCHDDNGDDYVVGDCVTAGAVCDSGWYICKDRHYDYEGDGDTCSFVCANNGQCPAGGGGGSGGGGSSTTVPYDVTKVAYAVLHDGTRPGYPVLEVNCTVEKKGDKYRAYYYAGKQACRYGQNGAMASAPEAGNGGSSKLGNYDSYQCWNITAEEWKACEQGPEWSGKTARFLCEYNETGRPSKVMCKWEGSGCNTCQKQVATSIPAPLVTAYTSKALVGSAEDVEVNFTAVSPLYIKSIVVNAGEYRHVIDLSGKKYLNYSGMVRFQLPDGTHEVEVGMDADKSTDLHRFSPICL